MRMVISKLEVDLGRQLDVPRRSAQGDDGKLLLVRLRKRLRSELTAAGAGSAPLGLRLQGLRA